MTILAKFGSVGTAVLQKKIKMEKSLQKIKKNKNGRVWH
jgi:hypothetical protein